MHDEYDCGAGLPDLKFEERVDDLFFGRTTQIRTTRK